VATTKGKIRYDKLVVALGSETEFFGIPGLNKHAFTLMSIEDAERVRTHIRDMFFQAKNERNEARRRSMLRIIVGGGGFTGVEFATELIGYISRLSKQFETAPNEPEFIVVEAGDTVLPGFDSELVRRAQQVMEKIGIRLLLKTPCVSAEKNSVSLKSGEKIPVHTIIWTGGVRANDLVAESGLKYGPRSRVVVNPYLESVDHPGVYVIGDNALVVDPVTYRPLAPTAQLALQQAEVAAFNIYSEIKGTKRVRYVPKVAGQFVSLGGRNAVGWVWKFKVAGFTAWFLKRMTVVRYLYSIGGLPLTVPRLFSLFFS
jgi:NADH dehydrogenase